MVSAVSPRFAFPKYPTLRRANFGVMSRIYERFVSKSRRTPTKHFSRRCLTVNVRTRVEKRASIHRITSDFVCLRQIIYARSTTNGTRSASLRRLSIRLFIFQQRRQKYMGNIRDHLFSRPILHQTNLKFKRGLLYCFTYTF